jgi:hypothetical protein
MSECHIKKREEYRQNNRTRDIINIRPNRHQNNNYNHKNDNDYTTIKSKLEHKIGTPLPSTIGELNKSITMA